MIAFGVITFLYLFIGWVVSYEAFKNHWNERLSQWDRTDNIGWWMAWPWFGSMILSQTINARGARFHVWSQNTLTDLFGRMTDFEWRKRNGTKDES